MNIYILIVITTLASLVGGNRLYAGADFEAALRRAEYLLNGTMPTDAELAASAGSEANYRTAVDSYLNNAKFYDVMVRYHERVYGVGLKDEYLDELKLDNIDGHANKIATVNCERTTGDNVRYRCGWASDSGKDRTGGCSPAQELPARAFWYTGVVAWACPSVFATCGSDLSRCFIKYNNQNEAKSSEFGATEIFDSSVAIVKSLSRQSAGLAAAVVISGYPYTKVLEPGLTAIDGAVAHLYRQVQHFDLGKMSIPGRVLDIANATNLAHTHYQLVYTGSANAYEQGGVLSSFGWLRRYEKNRSRANQLYQRLLCRQFTAQLPRVFPQDPGNLRTTPGCMGCHSTLDPLADFFKVWGEGGGLYDGHGATVTSSFGGKDGTNLSDLANIIRGDNAFGTCTVEKAWNWMMGRDFYHGEADLRAALTSYFVTTNYNFKELVYAIATHPAFVEATRSDAVVGDPLEEPPLGQPPGGEVNRPCTTTINFTTDIQPSLTQCTTCHSAGNTANIPALDTQAQWKLWRGQAVSMMASGNMPPGQAGPPLLGAVYDLKEKVRCWTEQNP